MDFTSSEEIITAFIDAGCNKEQIEIVKKNIKNKNILAQILLNQRKKVLAKLYKNEEKLKCIDYLIFNLKK